MRNWLPGRINEVNREAVLTCDLEVLPDAAREARLHAEVCQCRRVEDSHQGRVVVHREQGPEVGAERVRLPAPVGGQRVHGATLCRGQRLSALPECHLASMASTPG